MSSKHHSTSDLISADSISKSTSYESISDELKVIVRILFSPIFRDQFEALASGIFSEKITGDLSVVGSEVDKDQFGQDRFDVFIGHRRIFTRALRPYLSTPRIDDIVRQVQNQVAGASVFEIDRSK